MENEQAYEEITPEQLPQKRGGSHKKLYFIIGIVAVVVALLVVTCPSRESHREAVKDVVREAIGKEIGGDKNTWSMIGAFFAGSLMNTVVDNMLEVDNYGVCSVGRTHVGGKSKTLSFGILGHVFTFSADDIEKNIEGSGDSDTDEYKSPVSEDDSPISNDDSDANDDDSDLRDEYGDLTEEEIEESDSYYGQ